MPPEASLEALIAEIDRRGLRAAYIHALAAHIDPDEVFELYWSAIETGGEGGWGNVFDFLWDIIHTTPDQRRSAALQALDLAAPESHS